MLTASRCRSEQLQNNDNRETSPKEAMFPDEGNRLILLVPEEGVEPTLSQGERDFESRASASSATPAGVVQNISKGSGGSRGIPTPEPV